MLVSAPSGLQGKWRIEAINFKATELKSLVFRIDLRCLVWAIFIGLCHSIMKFMTELF